MMDDIEAIDGARLHFCGGVPPLVRVLLTAGMDIEAGHIRELHARFLERIDEKSRVLIDSRQIASMTREARELAASDHISPFVHRLAVLIDGPVSAMISNFFIRVSRPSYPVHTFTDEARAMAWLSEASQ